ncbi:recombinase family protein [Oceanirhabdus sp. W0125-5]|uniref:recombinase family protein n=1 Tax=Oceanirhabdus sp. W0125-5 TaxID=2999116 RepID=UPI0022F2FDF4|nr:recombinase family protein [Oceanirhabdus sp. W0125-5]WBW95288.1 recombinase family protein [Oceanirhabdus sp. W0125-5]
MKAAIYSRKSIFTGKGESIENQIELCKEYCNKYLDIDEFLIYEDEGFSGGNTNRPQFQNLMKDAKEKKFQVLICYRLDRISRNIADFSSIIDTLEDYDISFVSIREQFDTSTPMGRAMMYIASVFAQLERETIAERVRDNAITLAKTGRWLGGLPPFGFDSEKLTYRDEELKERSMMILAHNESEIQLAKTIFVLYLKHKSLSKVCTILTQKNLRSKQGSYWNNSKLTRLLTNPLFVKSDENIINYYKNLGITVHGTPNGNGIITYNKTKKLRIQRNMTEWIFAISKHKGIISSDDWINVQNIIEGNKSKAPRFVSKSATMLSGTLRCAKCGSVMIINHGRPSAKTGERINYYVCSLKIKSNKARCDNKNVRVDQIQKAVIDEIKNYNLKLKNENFKPLLKDLNNSSNEKEISSLEQTISSKEKSMSNLVKKLSLAEDDISNYILEEMNKLNKEIQSLKETLKEEVSKSKDIDKIKINIDAMYKALDHFDSTIDCLPEIEDRKQLLKSVVEKITWDGDTCNVEVTYWGCKKK